MSNNGLKKNTIYSVIKTCSAIVFPLITFPYISRVLLAENVGKINFGLSIVSYFTLIAGLGISTYAIRECAAVKNDRKKLGNIASQIYSINIITTIVAYGLLLCTLLFYNKMGNYRLLITIQSLSIVFTTIGADWLNTATEDFGYITIRTVLFQLISLILMFAFVHEPKDYYKYAVISLVSSSGANLVNVWYRRKYCKLRFTLEINWKKHFTPIVYMFVMILAQTILNSVDTTMLGLIHGDLAVGIYSTATKISNIISQLGGAIMWVVIPRLSIYFAEKNYSEINNMLKTVLVFLTTLGFPLALGTIFVADDIITIIAGKGYEPSANVLRVLMIGFLISQFSGFLGNAILLPSKQEKYYMLVCVVSALVNIVTNYIFIPKYGAVAAAGTTVLSTVVVVVLLFFKVDNNIKISRIRDVFVPQVVGTLLIVGICMFFRNINNIWIRIFIQVGLSVVGYGMVQLLMHNMLVYDLYTSFISKIKKKM